MMEKKILIVDDSSFTRVVISEIINEFSEFVVESTAKNGKEAVELIKKNNYDVVLLDIEMPELNGIEALKQIKSIKPNLNVIIFSSLAKNGAEETITALDYGAFDFIPKPSLSAQVRSDAFKKHLHTILLEAASLSNQSHQKRIKNVSINHDDSLKNEPALEKDNLWESKRGKYIVAIGISTGGPKALQELLPKFSSFIKAPIIIVQHMPKGFIEAMSKRLNNISDIVVKIAEDGETLKNGVCYIAPIGTQTIVIESRNELFIHLKEDFSDVLHKPSVECLFNSLTKVDSYDIIGVMMTGMGSDGANEMKKLHDKGAYCIAQSERTCAVYGMPRVAVDLGAIDKIVDLENIAKEIEYRLEV